METIAEKNNGQSITQLQPFNRNELIYKTMQLFEPAETFETNLEQQDPSLQRVGENPPYDSSEDEKEEPEEETKQKIVTNQTNIKEEFEQLQKRGFMARRGRNGQLLLQFLPEDILQEQEVD